MTEIINTYFTDYFPFGMQMPDRFYNSENYRYGYQGSEKDDEIAGEGNSYTTHYRLLDPRLGRWKSVDPKGGVNPQHSPYVSMGDNPIWFNDPLGDIFDPTSQKEIDKHKEITQDMIAINKLESDILLTTGRNINYQKIDDLRSTNGELKQASSEIKDLEESEKKYSISKIALNDKIGGQVRYENGVAIAEYTSTSTLAHELKHLYQFEKGDLSFVDKSGYGGYLYDISDEQEAYRRQSFYDNNIQLRILTASQIRSMGKKANLYQTISDGPLNVNSTLKEVFGDQPKFKTFLELLTEKERNTQFKVFAKQLGDIIK